MPRCLLIAAMTLCGQIAPLRFSSPEDRRHLEAWRDRTDASLLGAGTLRDADPEMRGSGGILRENRIRALVSVSGRIPLADRRLFMHGPPPLIFTPENRATRLQESLGPRARVLTAPLRDKVLDLKSVLHTLENLGVSSLLLEGGGGLNFQALRQGVVDELLLTIFPQISGNPQGTPLVSGPAPMEPTERWRLLNYRAGDLGELFLHYERTSSP